MGSEGDDAIYLACGRFASASDRRSMICFHPRHCGSAAATLHQRPARVRGTEETPQAPQCGKVAGKWRQTKRPVESVFIVDVRNLADRGYETASGGAEAHHIIFVRFVSISKACRKSSRWRANNEDSQRTPPVSRNPERCLSMLLSFSRNCQWKTSTGPCFLTPRAHSYWRNFCPRNLFIDAVIL